MEMDNDRMREILREIETDNEWKRKVLREEAEKAFKVVHTLRPYVEKFPDDQDLRRIMEEAEHNIESILLGFGIMNRIAAKGGEE